MRAAEEAALNSYGWVDKDAGIVKIPVDRAMEILAKKGLPARKQEEDETADDGSLRILTVSPQPHPICVRCA